jgi:hypothetical protein
VGSDAATTTTTTKQKVNDVNIVYEIAGKKWAKREIM